MVARNGTALLPRTLYDNAPPFRFRRIVFDLRIWYTVGGSRKEPQGCKRNINLQPLLNERTICTLLFVPNSILPVRAKPSKRLGRTSNPRPQRDQTRNPKIDYPTVAAPKQGIASLLYFGHEEWKNCEQEIHIISLRKTAEFISSIQN